MVIGDRYVIDGSVKLTWLLSLVVATATTASAAAPATASAAAYAAATRVATPAFAVVLPTAASTRVVATLTATTLGCSRAPTGAEPRRVLCIRSLLLVVLVPLLRGDVVH